MIPLIVAAELCLFYSKESYVSLTLNNDACDLFWICMWKSNQAVTRKLRHALYMLLWNSQPNDSQNEERFNGELSSNM